MSTLICVSQHTGRKQIQWSLPSEEPGKPSASDARRDGGNEPEPVRTMSGRLPPDAARAAPPGSDAEAAPKLLRRLLPPPASATAAAASLSKKLALRFMKDGTLMVGMPVIPAAFMNRLGDQPSFGRAPAAAASVPSKASARVQTAGHWPGPALSI